MNPQFKFNRWNQVQNIFQGALELSVAERNEYLARACGDDKELRSEVLSLLANDSTGTATLHALVAGDLKELSETSRFCDSGLKIGAYRLVRELDGGGMEIVYLAVRSDEHYFQIVAIKMVRRGMESPALLQRFRTERQILATLTHPNIGAILDGGITDDGRPYIVMEYVEGQPVTAASEARGLSIRQRIELFRSVCSAVHYAHQKLVIHRDIKPNNVLVTPEGTVKLIDFGISKPLIPGLVPGDSSQTEGCQRLMTPDYASPEQLLGHPITTATDIYSLGVLLFEVLTGSRPYTLRDLSPSAAEKVVCEQTTRKPSAVQELPKQTRKHLKGDLDRIVLMAMDKDPNCRYASAEDLNQDLQRFLEGKPILARRATPVYRLRKFVTRHKIASIMACAMCGALACSIFVVSRQSRSAKARIIQAEGLVDSAISDMTEKLQQSSASIELQTSLFRSTLTYLNELKEDSGNDPQVLLKLAKAYQRLGDLEGSPFVANLGNSERAEGSYREALRLASDARARLPGEESTRTVIDSYQRLGRIETYLGKTKDASENYRQCIPIASSFWQQSPHDPTRIRFLAMNQFGLGEVEFANREPDKALNSFHTALEIVGSDANGDEPHDQLLIRLYARIARSFNELGNQEACLVNFRRSIELTEDLARKSPQSKPAQRALFAAYQTFVAPLWGSEMINAGDPKSAQFYARKALSLAEALAAGDSTNAQASSDLAYAYWTVGSSFRSTEPSLAEPWYRKSVEATKKLGARRLLAFREESLAESLVTKKQAAERLHLLLEANGIRQTLTKTEPELPEHRLQMMHSYCLLSDAELASGDLIKAREYADRAVPFLDEFKLTSPSLIVLRGVAYCHKILGNVQSRIATDRSLSPYARNSAAVASRDWYEKSDGIWKEWVRRGATTMESEAERHKVEQLLKATAALVSR